MSPALAVAAWLALAPGTGGQPQPEPGVEVIWSAPEACPGADALVAEIERYLGQPIDAPRTQWIRASASVERAEPAWSLSLAIENRAGTAETHVDSPTCDALAELAALKIAMAIDPLAVLDAMQRGDDPQADPSPPPSPTRPGKEPAPADVERRPAAPRVALSIHTAGGWGVLPRIGVGVGGSAALMLGRWRIAAGGGFWFPRAVDLDDGWVQLRLGTGHLTGCGVPTWRSLEFPLCVGAEAGAARGRGFGLDQNRTTRQPWVALSASPGLMWLPASRVGLWLAPSVLWALVRPGFAVDGTTLVHRAAPAAARVSVGVELRFP